MTEIIPGRLWQCGDGEVEGLRAHENIGAIINLTHSWYPYKEPTIYLHWGFDDGPVPDKTSLEGVVHFVVGLVRAGIPTIVHCNAGLNRSGLVCARVVQSIHHLKPQQAIDHIRICRHPQALCNDAFVNYLLNRID